MEMADLLMSVFVGLTLFVVYVTEYLRNNREVFGKPAKARVRVVDPYVLYTRSRRFPQ